MSRLVVLLLLVATRAAADGNPRIDVTVGQTVQVDVGVRRGLICDDLQIITPDLRTLGTHNYLVITGNAPGATQCRVGTEPGMVGILYDVVVAKKK
jgi:hypothetical protein|nr:hypothetical protein [Kofleriaceae bacterium]